MKEIESMLQILIFLSLYLCKLQPLQPYVLDPRYFKLCILFDQIMKIKVLESLSLFHCDVRMWECITGNKLDENILGMRKVLNPFHSPSHQICLVLFRTRKDERLEWVSDLMNVENGLCRIVQELRQIFVCIFSFDVNIHNTVIEYSLKILYRVTHS